LLDDTDYGYVGLAFAVYAFAALIQQGGILDMLIQRGREYEHWANAAFWLSLTMGVASTAILVAAAPLAARFLGDARLTPLIIVLSTQLVLHATCIVPEARLRIEMRFKLLSALGLAMAVAVTGMTIAFAWLGFDAYSFILPVPIVMLARSVALWSLAPVRVRAHPELDRWPQMLGANGILFAASVFQTIAWQSDYLILGRLYPNEKSMVGRYYWAYNLSTQTAQLLALNVAGILLPSLSRLQDDVGRMREAFLRSAKVLTAVGVPACLIQAALAEPIVRLAFEPKWHPAIPIIEVLSIGFAFTVVFPACGSLLKAQGRLWTLLFLTAISASLFLLCVYVGARHSAGIGAAWGVAVQSLLIGPPALYLTIRPLGGRWADVGSIFLMPLVAGACAIGAAWWVAGRLPPMPAREIARAFIIALAIPGYMIALRIAAPTVWTELLERGRGLIRR
jgi:PST family polysaccharide transporter